VAKSNKSTVRQVLSVVFPAIALAAILGSGVILKTQYFFTKAASTCGYINAQLSTDGKNPALSVDLPSGRPTKYYLHVTTGTPPIGCETAFDVSYQSCNNGVCGNWSNPSAWGTYRSDTNGVTRLDLDGPWPEKRTMNMKFRPRGSTLALSNQVSVNFIKKPDPTVLSMSDYYIFKPGYLWEYQSSNLKNGIITGTTRLQIENETTFCGIRFYPWRFTKDNLSIYWNPGRGRNLRWFIVNPAYTFTEIPGYNNYIWGFGDLDYTGLTLNNQTGTFDSVNGLRDINLSKLENLYMYKNFNATNPGLPSYNLTPKTVPANETYISRQTESVYARAWPYSIPPLSLPTTTCKLKADLSEIPGGSYLKSSWKLRVEKDYLPPWGEVVRTDQYEGGANLETDGLLRESWYFAKGVGLVKIATKTFNNYAGDSKSLACKDDSDCWSDTISHPFTEMTLKNYYQNPTLSVSVSTDGVNYSPTITTTVDKGYYLKVNPAYTGYLENYPNIKWLWVQDGIVKVPNGYGAGKYTPKFRIWVPNEVITGETRINPVSIPWSNQVEINVTASPNCTNSTWYTAPNFKGLNWCYGDGNMCSSDWVTGPKITVDCGSNRLQNVGSYCSRPDGTKSFVGKTNCVP